MRTSLPVRPISSDVTIDTTRMRTEELVPMLSELLNTAANRSADVDPLLGDIDCLQIPVPDLESGLAFYRDALGQALLWRTRAEAGLQLSHSRAEIVVQTQTGNLEANLSVTSADVAAQRFVEAGGVVIVPPFDIAIGRCTVVQDPWGNRLVLLDHRHGRLATDADRFVVGTSSAEPPRDAS